MIDLSAYPKFKQDIENKQISVYPIIIIDNSIYISTIKEVIDGNQYFDYGLKLSNIKESINLIDRNFKISNVTLSLNNYAINGQRMSDNISDYISKDVEIYYKSQSCQVLDDCLPVYKGLLKDAKYTDREITITLEDLTEKTLHKDVPIANLGYSENLFSKEYKNRYIPITYGKVDKAPAVIYKDSKNSEGRIYIISDNIFGVNNPPVEMKELNTLNHLEGNLMGEIKSPLYIYKNNYFNVLLDADENDIGGDFEFQNQFRISEDSNYLYIDREFNLDMPRNPPASNILDCVRVVFPNEVKLLKPNDEGGTFLDAELKPVILIEETIDSIEAIIDNPNVQSEFILDEENFMSTSASIPNAEIDDNLELFVHEFTPYNYENAIADYLYFPRNNTLMSYAWHITAYLYASANKFQLDDNTSAIKFVEMPTADLVKAKVQEHLDVNHIGQTLRSDATHMYQPQVACFVDYAEFYHAHVMPGTGYYDYTYDAWSFYNTPGQPGYGGGATLPHGFSTVPKFESDLTNQFRDFYGTTPDSHNHVYEDNTYTVPGGDISVTTFYLHKEDYTRSYLENASYPSAVYYFVMDMQTPSSHPDYTFAKLVANQIDWLEPDQLYGVYVGQWNSLVMQDESWLLDTEGATRAIFINIFDDGSGKPFLFNLDDFAVFSPTEVPFQHDNVPTIGEYIYGFKYKSRWNGKEIGELNNSYGSTCIHPNYYWWEGDYHDELDNPYRCWGQQRLKSNKLCGIDDGRINSWCLYMTEGIPQDALTEAVFNTTRPGIPGDGTTIKPNTIIPCNHNNGYGSSSEGSGFNLSFDYDILNDPDDFRIACGTSGSSGEKIMLSFPFSDLSADDAYTNTTRTYAYGKVLCNFNPGGSLDEAVQTDGTNNFQVLISGTSIEQLEGEATQTLNFSSIDEGLMTAIIDVQGGTLLNNEGESAIFSSISEEEDNQFNWDSGTNYKISDWVEPDLFNSIALTYSLVGDNSKIISLDTRITAIALMQFVAFDRALDSNFYIDVYGRANTVDDIVGGYYKYVNELVLEDESKKMIENPADVMYHFMEKELGSIDITNRVSWQRARAQANGINLAFSIKDKINSKELFNEISKSCNLIPIFKQDGNFGFSTINNSYSGHDLEIKKDEIIAFQLEHTPLSQIYTMVNVKYKKDYELDEYTKETGYCDGYDFFGNGDNGYPNGYKYNSFGLERTDNILEFESEYIRNKTSALNLRNFLYLYHCNRHAVVKVTLPIKYSNIEVGDVISFDKLVNNIKSFGESYSNLDINLGTPNYAPIIRNGQIIYPLFIVNSITKSPKVIKIEATQLHKLDRNFTAGVGSLSRMSSQGIYDPSTLSLEDYNILYDVILEEESENQKYITSEQKYNSDINSNGVISLNDLNSLGQLLGLPNVFPSGDVEEEENIWELGDVNQDGTINVTDIILIVSFILGGNYGELDYADFADEDGNINVNDVVAMVAYILAGGT